MLIHCLVSTDKEGEADERRMVRLGHERRVRVQAAEGHVTLAVYTGRPTMSEIEIDTGLTGYLEKDAAVADASCKEWEPEYLALSRMVDIFRRIAQLVEVKDKNLSLPSQLFLVVLNQSYGVASELLRRRTRDAQALMRRAVEAAGVAHQLWKHPELTQIFNEAYPHINDDNHPKQFRPSNKYRQEFSYDKLFSGDSSALQTLGSLIELFSVGASHAGLGAFEDYKKILKGRTPWIPDIKKVNL